MSTYSNPCAFCLNEGSNIVDPRELPCHHVYCFGCLEDALITQSNKEVFKCPVCRIKHILDGHTGIASLPKATLPLETQSRQALEVSVEDDKGIPFDSCCDTCSQNGPRHAAVVFCQHCNLRLCVGHSKSHDHLFGELKHHVITIEKFSRQRDQLAADSCSEHNREPLVCVCVKCKKLFCLTCWAHPAKDCGDGEKHKIRPVLGVGKEMKKRLREVMEPVILLQSKLDKLIIQSDDQLISAVTELDGLIFELNEARDLQFQEIRKAYEQIEEKIIKVREDTIAQYRAYHERLQEEITRLQFACKEADQVLASDSNIDVVLQAERVILSLTTESLCETEPPSFHKVEIIPTGHSRLAEVDLLITAPYTHNALLPDIKVLHLDKRIPTQGWCYAASHSAQGGMVVCRDKGFDYLDKKGNVTRSLELYGEIHSCCLYNNSVYVVHWDNNRRWIRVYDKEGQLMHCWPVSGSQWITQLALVSEMIFLPNPNSKGIEVYSRSGKLLYNFTHPSFISPYRVTAAGHQHIIVTDPSAHLVSKFTIADHSLVWQYKEVHHPSGTAVDIYGRIWLASCSKKFVHVLSADGQLLVKLDVPHADCIRGIAVHFNWLAVATYWQKELLLYKFSS